MRAFALILALILSGCVRLPGGLHAADAHDLVLVSATRTAWAAHGRELPASEALANVYVWTSNAENVQAWCHAPAPINSCVNSGRDLFGPARANIYITEGGPLRYDALVIHEVLHVLRGAWVLAAQGTPDYTERYNRGRNPTCNPLTMVDHGHCDTEVWTTIEQAAIREVSP